MYVQKKSVKYSGFGELSENHLLGKAYDSENQRVLGYLGKLRNVSLVDS